jgi:hypothetical protein
VEPAFTVDGPAIYLDEHQNGDSLEEEQEGNDLARALESQLGSMGEAGGNPSFQDYWYLLNNMHALP